MAHQFISFLVIFTLGLGLVISTATLMSNISTSIQEDSSTLELRLTLKDVHHELLDMIDLASTMDEGSFSQQILLKASLARRFTYQITVSKVSGKYFLVGNITDNEDRLNDFVELNLPSADRNIVISGSFNSIHPIHQVSVLVNATTISFKLHDVTTT